MILLKSGFSVNADGKHFLRMFADPFRSAFTVLPSDDRYRPRWTLLPENLWLSDFPYTGISSLSRNDVIQLCMRNLHKILIVPFTHAGFLLPVCILSQHDGVDTVFYAPLHEELCRFQHIVLYTVVSFQRHTLIVKCRNKFVSWSFCVFRHDPADLSVVELIDGFQWLSIKQQIWKPTVVCNRHEIVDTWVNSHDSSVTSAWID